MSDLFENTTISPDTVWQDVLYFVNVLCASSQNVFLGNRYLLEEVCVCSVLVAF